MGGMDFQAPETKEHETEESIQHNKRIGLLLFAVYVLFYASFMLISAFFPNVMSSPAIAGLNLAIVYGFALILLAFVLALVYMKLCIKSNAGGEQ